MGVVLFKDSIIAKKYGGFWECIQAFADLPAGYVLTVTYNPPAGKVFVPVYVTFGDMAIGKFKVTIIKDGEYYFKDIFCTAALEREFFRYIILTPVKHEAVDIITNTDTVTRTLDLLFFGLLIPESEYEAFLEEVSGRKELKVLEEIRDLLKK